MSSKPAIIHISKVVFFLFFNPPISLSVCVCFSLSLFLSDSDLNHATAPRSVRAVDGPDLTSLRRGEQERRTSRSSHPSWGGGGGGRGRERRRGGEILKSRSERKQRRVLAAASPQLLKARFGMGESGGQCRISTHLSSPWHELTLLLQNTGSSSCGWLQSNQRRLSFFVYVSPFPLSLFLSVCVAC